MLRLAFVVLCLSALVAVNGVAVTRSQCSFLVSSQLGQPTPILLQPHGNIQFRGSTSSPGTIILNAGDQISFACTGTNNFLLTNGSPYGTATCVSGTTFSMGGTNFEIGQFTCSVWPVAVNRASGTCLSGHTLVQTGFETNNGFVEAYTGCHTTSLHHTFYTKFVMRPDVAGFQTGVSRSDWEDGSFFVGVDPTTQYKRATQRITMTSLLGSAALAEQYIHLTNDYFLSKGHLVAKADFFLGAHQLSTFFYSNAAPQWQTFNGNNWNSLENDVRKFSNSIDADIDVYTGTYGRATLPDVNGNQVELFLTTTGVMPVPRMFWKLLHNTATNTGIAFVGLNNPYQEESTIAADVLCNDICDQISWLTWTQNSIAKGYSYCCEVNEFLRVFPDTPSISVSGILS